MNLREREMLGEKLDHIKGHIDDLGHLDTLDDCEEKTERLKLLKKGLYLLIDLLRIEKNI